MTAPAFTKFDPRAFLEDESRGFKAANLAKAAKALAQEPERNTTLAGLAVGRVGIQEHQSALPPGENCIVEWLNQHPAPSTPGRCARCGRAESPSAIVLPFGTEPGTHAWLHAECWAAWHQARRTKAAAALHVTLPRS